ncbi:MAG: phosphate ABC transporter substrate-binding protein [Ignavibacteriae bacterium]|nr:phosphate ABC transporter substrate-binding protein [Ignavibacteriota bacterium]
MRTLKLISIIIFFVSCSNSTNLQKNIIRIKGSDTMLLINQKLAEKFMIEHPNISIYIEGGGSAEGIKSLLNSEVDICASSRTLDPNEIKELAEKFNTIGMSFLIAKDALSIYVNEKNSIRNISLNNLEKIFTCEITNWKELGGFNSEIKVASRPTSSGTYGYFKKHVLLDQEFCDNSFIIPTTKQIVEFIKNNENAIGYGGVGYGDESIEISVNNFKPSEENVINGNYPLARYLRYYATNKISGITQAYIDWVVSEKGQKIIKENGFFPLY